MHGGDQSKLRVLEDLGIATDCQQGKGVRSSVELAPTPLVAAYIRSSCVSQQYRQARRPYTVCMGTLRRTGIL
jgi:hypothetical protein